MEYMNKTVSGFGVQEKIKEQLDNRADAGHSIRVGIGDKIVDVTPSFQNDNIRPGTLVGLTYAAIATTIDELAPVDIAAETEITNVERVDEGMMYTVNVDAPLEQQGRFQALAESGQGFISFMTDDMEVKSQSLPRKRVVRDTWQFEVLVKDTNPTDPKRKLGFGILNKLSR